MVQSGTARPGATSLNTMRTRVPMPTLRDQLRRGEIARRGREIAGDAQPVMLGRHALLRVELDDQDEIRQMILECRLDRVVDLGIGEHRARCPRPRSRSPRDGRTRGSPWSAGSAAGRRRRSAAGGTGAPRSGESTRGSPDRAHRCAAPSRDNRPPRSLALVHRLSRPARRSRRRRGGSSRPRGRRPCRPPA